MPRRTAPRLLGDGNVVVPATCPAFTLRTAYEGASSRFRVFDEAGEMAGRLVANRAGKRLKVGLIVVEKKYRRCKLATRCATSEIASRQPISFQPVSVLRMGTRSRSGSEWICPCATPFGQM